MSTAHREQAREAEASREKSSRESRPRSLVLVNTGDGKGKSTAAFGVAIRGLARGWRVCVIQFIKSDKWKIGEKQVISRLGADWLTGGDGFSWESTDLEQSGRRALESWQIARTAIEEARYDLIVLDELTYPINWGWIELEDVVATIRGRPTQVNLVITGRRAPAELIEAADTVTEMVKVKHVFDRGVRARRGIDF
jgi:cob(I)alamin adenosyltransferase